MAATGSDVNCGSGCTAFMMIISIIYMALTLAYSLVMRIYLKAFYCSSYIAGWSVIIAAFVLFHHICKIRWALSCSLKTFGIYQAVLNTFLMLCNAAIGAGYVLLTVTSIHLNYDYMIAAILAFVNLLLLLYLLWISVLAARGSRYSMYSFQNNSLERSRQKGYQGRSNNYEMDNVHDLYSETGSNKELMGMKRNKGCCQKCCSFLCRCFFGLIYYPVLIVLIVILVTSTCYPYFVFSDISQFREKDFMYTVEVDGHRPLSLFMKCRGNGSTTIVYENGLGGMAYMQWDFMPAMLEDKYTVCVHDRRGYGWSESYEQDYFQLLWKEPQWSKINSKFFVKLVEQANISTPFYYMGHSYGGSHLVYTTNEHPELIKGLVFLDSVELNAVSAFQSFLEVIANFQPSGLLYIVLKAGFNYKTAFESVGDFYDITPYTDDMLISAVRSGTYCSSYLREWIILDDDNSEYNTHPSVIYQSAIDKPTLVIDKADRSYWFPDSNFTQYNRSFYAQVPNTTHTNLVYSIDHGHTTAMLIDNFVMFAEGEIGYDSYTKRKSSILSVESTATTTAAITNSGVTTDVMISTDNFTTEDFSTSAPNSTTINVI